jgi:GT2 family glycosyltransferase
MFTNFNRGIREARGDYVVYFHDDDVYQPSFIEAYVRLLESHPDVGFAGGNFDIIDDDGRVLRRNRGVTRTETWDGHRFIERIFRRGRSDLPTPALFFRRSALERFDFDEQISIHWGDYTVQMRMAEQWGVALMADALYSWRKHGRNDSNISLSHAMRIRTRVMLDFCDEYLARHPDEQPFVEKLRALNHRAQLWALTWAWLGAADAADASVCRELLRPSHPRAAGTLLALERLGLSAERRRTLMPAVRRVAALLDA